MDNTLEPSIGNTTSEGLFLVFSGEWAFVWFVRVKILVTSRHTPDRSFRDGAHTIALRLLHQRTN